MNVVKKSFNAVRYLAENTILKAKILLFLGWIFFMIAISMENTHQVLIKIPFSGKEFFAPAWFFTIFSYPIFSIFMGLFNRIKMPKHDN
jgi:hypothetical protein